MDINDFRGGRLWGRESRRGEEKREKFVPQEDFIKRDEGQCQFGEGRDGLVKRSEQREGASRVQEMDLLSFEITAWWTRHHDE